MSSVVSTIIGSNAQENVANTQANAAKQTSKYAADIGYKTAAEQLAEQKSEFGQGLSFEKAGRQTASEQLAEAGLDINRATSAAPSELLNLKSDIESGANREMQDVSKQSAANLAMAGVRGGQAATLQNRAVGEVGLKAEKSINEMLAEDAAQRRAAKTGFYTTIGGTSAGRT